MDWIDEAYEEAMRQQCFGANGFKATLREAHEAGCPHKAAAERVDARWRQAVATVREERSNNADIVWACLRITRLATEKRE